MYKKLISISLLFLFLLIISCRGRESESTEQQHLFSRFPGTTKLVLEDFLDFNNRISNRLYVNDTSIFIRNISGASDFFFYQYALDSKALQKRHFKGGRGYGQAFGSLSSGLDSSRVWMFDVSLKKVLMSDVVSADIDSATREFLLSDFYYSTELIDSLKFIATGADHTPFKVQEVDIVTGEILEEYGVFNNVPKGIDLYSWKMAHESFLFLKPGGNKVVLAHRLTDQIEIFDLVTKESVVVQGPDNFAPQFNPIVVNDYHIIERTPKTRFAFVDGFASEKYIYLLYSGNKHFSDYLDYGKYIFVYDWEGTPIHKFETDYYISAFTLSQDSKIYAFNPYTSKVVVGSIDH